jgi:hypothetical protein
MERVRFFHVDLEIVIDQKLVVKPKIVAIRIQLRLVERSNDDVTFGYFVFNLNAGKYHRVSLTWQFCQKATQDLPVLSIVMVSRARQSAKPFNEPPRACSVRVKIALGNASLNASERETKITIVRLFYKLTNVRLFLPKMLYMVFFALKTYLYSVSSQHQARF